MFLLFLSIKVDCFSEIVKGSGSSAPLNIADPPSEFAYTLTETIGFSVDLRASFHENPIENIAKIIVFQDLENKKHCTPMKTLFPISERHTIVPPVVHNQYTNSTVSVHNQYSISTQSVHISVQYQYTLYKRCSKWAHNFRNFHQNIL